MNSRLKKIILLLLAAGFLFGAGQIQQSLNHERDALGLTRGAVLENAPPMLAFTTVALGGFRGLISNFLWMRANDLQQDDIVPAVPEVLQTHDHCFRIIEKIAQNHD